MLFITSKQVSRVQLNHRSMQLEIKLRQQLKGPCRGCEKTAQTVEHSCWLMKETEQQTCNTTMIALLREESCDKPTGKFHARPRPRV